MMSTIPQSACSFTDSSCICDDTNLTAAISGCLARTCTVIEMLGKKIPELIIIVIREQARYSLMPVTTEAQRYSKTSCGAPVRSQPESPIIAFALLATSFMAVSARVITRSPWMNGKWSFWWDDWITLSCLVCITQNNYMEIPRLTAS